MLPARCLEEERFPYAVSNLAPAAEIPLNNK
jgi:hypothetical protein